VIQVTAEGEQLADAYNLSRGSFHYELGRKGALLMLAVVILWTAIPASACLFAVHSTGQPDSAADGRGI